MKPEDHDIVLAELDESPAMANPSPAKSNVSFIEQLLSPRSLQWMMACGSGLLMLGFFVWLWTVGVFENPLVVAISAGAATLTTLAAGITIVRKTRYQLAGQWLTLLGALTLPLNLYLYDVQGLITLSEGGHLWIPAAICCFIYGGIARALRDAKFVYALVAGVVMTGLLLLADTNVNRFWELLPSATFLLSVGWISVFAERFFGSDEGDFSREKFGLAFQRAGVIVVTIGLSLLLGGYLNACLGWLFHGFIPAVSLSQGQKVWALGLLVSSAAGFGVQGLVHQYRNYYLASFALLAAAIPVTLNIFAIPITLTSIAILAAGMTLALNVAIAVGKIGNRLPAGGDSLSYSSPMQFCSNAAISLLSGLAVFQIVFHFPSPELSLLAGISWWTTLQFALTWLAAWAAAWNARAAVNHAGVQGEGARVLFLVGGVVMMLTVWTAGLLQTVAAGQMFALAAIAIPLAMALLERFATNKRFAKTAGMAASLMVSVHLCLLGANQLTQVIATPHSQLLWIVSLAIAAVVYALASRGESISVDRFLCYASASGSLGLLTNWLGLDPGYSLVLIPMLIGTGIKVTSSIRSVSGESERQVSVTPFEMSGNFLVLGAGVASVLLAMSRWFEGGTTATLLMIMMVVLACTTLVSFLTKNVAWRTTFRALIAGIIGSSLCVLDGFLEIDGWHRGEICSLVAGAALLALGHVAWARETEGQQDDVATITLFFGCLLFVVPLAIGLLIYRTGNLPESNWRLFHEIGAIVGGLALLGAGLLCKVRSTTIAGGGLIAVFVTSLVTLLQWPNQLHSVSVVMMVGGGAFFAVAFLMSLYRDRLLSLPHRVRAGEGVFRVLKWR